MTPGSASNFSPAGFSRQEPARASGPSGAAPKPPAAADGDDTLILAGIVVAAMGPVLAVAALLAVILNALRG